MSHEVQPEALGHDAKIWDETSDVLGTVSSSAAGITVTTISSSVVADATGFNLNLAVGDRPWAAFISGLVIGTGALTALCLNAKGDLQGVRSKLSGYPEGAWPAFG